MSKVQIFCTTKFCQHNEQGECTAEAIHLEGCTPDADNVFACSEFGENGTTAGSLLRAEAAQQSRRKILLESESDNEKPD